MLHRLLYVSDCVQPGGPSLLGFAQILGASDANNRRDYLTGVLLHHAGQFLQVVEGARVDVERLKRRLVQDVRHRDMRVLFEGPIAARRFGVRPMGECRVGPTATGLLAGRPLHALTADEAGDVLEAACAIAEIAA